jgi:hypothetical protein
MMDGAPEVVAGICTVTISSTGYVCCNMLVLYPLGGMSETAADTTVLVCEQATQADRDHIIKR